MGCPCSNVHGNIRVGIWNVVLGLYKTILMEILFNFEEIKNGVCSKKSSGTGGN